MPSKRRLVTSEICFGTEKAGLLDFSYNKCALKDVIVPDFVAYNQDLPPNFFGYNHSPPRLFHKECVGQVHPNILDLNMADLFLSILVCILALSLFRIFDD